MTKHWMRDKVFEPKCQYATKHDSVLASVLQLLNTIGDSDNASNYRIIPGLPIYTDVFHSYEIYLSKLPVQFGYLYFIPLYLFLI